jgi:hypothetical protein
MDDTILYTRFEADGWVPPADVLAAPGGDMRRAQLMVTPDNRLHVFWQAGSDLMHSWATVEEALSAQGWSSAERTAVDLSGLANVREPFSLVTDAGGTIHALTVRLGQGSFGVAHWASHDGGTTWTEPASVYAAPDGSAIAVPRLAVSDSGTRLHAVWTEFTLPDGWPPKGVRHAASLDGGESWSSANVLGGDLEGWASAVTLGEDTVHVLWNGSQEAAGRYHAWSRDAGRTWESQVVTADYHGLTAGAPAAAFDSTGRLHVVWFADGVDRPQDIYYVTWDGAAWTPPAVVSPGDAGGIAGNPAMVVANGNELHALWQNSSGEATSEVVPPANGVWSASAFVSAPVVAPPTPVPAPATATPTAGLSAGETTVDLLADTATHTPAPQFTAMPLNESASPVGEQLLIALAILPSAVLVALIVRRRLGR